MDVAGTISFDSGHKRSKTRPFRAEKLKWNAVPCRWPQVRTSAISAKFVNSSDQRLRIRRMLSWQVSCAKCKWPERNCRLKRHLSDKQEATHGELSSFHPVEQLLHAGDERCSSVAADHSDALTGREPARRCRAQELKEKARPFDRAFRFSPWDSFRRLRPPPLHRRHRRRHPPRRLRLRSLRPWRRGAGSWPAGFRFP